MNEGTPNNQHVLATRATKCCKIPQKGYAVLYLNSKGPPFSEAGNKGQIPEDDLLTPIHLNP